MRSSFAFFAYESAKKFCFMLKFYFKKLIIIEF